MEQVDIEKVYQEIIAMKEVQIYILSKQIDKLAQEIQQLRKPKRGARKRKEE